MNENATLAPETALEDAMRQQSAFNERVSAVWREAQRALAARHDTREYVEALARVAKLRRELRV